MVPAYLIAGGKNYTYVHSQLSHTLRATSFESCATELNQHDLQPQTPTRADKQRPSLQRAPAVLRHGSALAPTSCFQPLTRLSSTRCAMAAALPAAIDQNESVRLTHDVTASRGAGSSGSGRARRRRRPRSGQLLPHHGRVLF